MEDFLPKFLGITFLTCVLFFNADCQDLSDAQAIISFSDKVLRHLETTQHRAEVIITKAAKKADRLFAKLDSATTGHSYMALVKKKIPLSEHLVYLDKIDSLKTMAKFLLDRNSNLTPDVVKKLEKVISGSDNLSELRNRAEAMMGAVRGQLSRISLPSAKNVQKLSKLNKDFNRIQNDIDRLSTIVKDPKALKGQVSRVVMESPAFHRFFRKHSDLAGFFHLPEDEQTFDSTQIAGLQTRAEVDRIVFEKFKQHLDPLVASKTPKSQQELTVIKREQAQAFVLLPDFMILQHSRQGDTDEPSAKPFGKRLSVRVNFQSERASNYLPATTNTGFSLGYQLSRKSIIGLGLAYRVGWGQNWNQLRISHQGIGMRSFLDVSIKSGFYVHGAFEMNHWEGFRSLAQLKESSLWRSSGLLGLGKSYRVARNYGGNIEILWDFLSYRSIPRTQPVIVRVGYTIR